MKATLFYYAIFIFLIILNLFHLIFIFPVCVREAKDCVMKLLISKHKIQIKERLLGFKNIITKNTLQFVVCYTYNA